MPEIPSASGGKDHKNSRRNPNPFLREADSGCEIGEYLRHHMYPLADFFLCHSKFHCKLIFWFRRAVLLEKIGRLLFLVDTRTCCHDTEPV
jgi:hypothetical protein